MDEMLGRSELPAPIRDYIVELAMESRAPAYLLVGDDGRLIEAGGDAAEYELTGLRAGEDAGTQLSFLAGLLPLDTDSFQLPQVRLAHGPYVDVYLFRGAQGTWVLLLNATPEATGRQRIQQRTYDLALQVGDLQREGDELYQAKSELEQQVSARTAELARANQQLLEELARRKRIEADLRDSEARFRRIVDSNMLGIMFWTAGGAVTEANNAFLDALGYTTADLQAGDLQWERISRTENRALDEKAFAQMAEYGACAPYERQFVHKDGRVVPLLFGAALLADSQSKIVCFTIDLSKYR